MSPRAEAATELRRLLRELAKDRDALSRRAEEVVQYLDLSGPPTAERAAAVALGLHFFYSGFEAFLERTLRVIDGAVPGGASWHVALLREAAEPIPGLRPELVEPGSIEDWLELLQFRHFLRNAYRVELDWAKLARNAARVARVHGAAIAAVDRATHLAESALLAIEGGDGR